MKAFGFDVRMKIVSDDGELLHSQLVYGDGVIMVADTSRASERTQIRTPSQVGGGNTQSMMVYVDDVEAHYARAREAGATIISELETMDHGEDYWSDRGYECEDIGGHHWWFYQRLRTAESLS